MPRCAAFLAVALALVAASNARAQAPASPLSTADGRGTLGGTLSVTVGPDDTGYFNYTDYDRSLVRMAQLDVTGSWKAGDRVTLLGALRLQNMDAQALALYVRVRPWTTHAFDIQAGVIPPTFGAFPRRAYGADNPLVGEPLAYQYLTSLRADALPSSADELERMRGRGWLSSYSLGNVTPAHGLPLVSASRWDTGVQAHAQSEHVEATLAVTAGSLSNPLFRDDNGSRQVAGRLVFHPTPGLVIGASVARGGFATRAAEEAAARLTADGNFSQQAVGGDVEYSKDYLLVRAESVVSLWRVPTVGADPLRAFAISIEGRYKLQPGLYVAARFDTLEFSDITAFGARAPWEAPVRRIEVGGGYSLQRNLVAKLAYQYNTREGGRVHSLGLLTAQLMFWM